MRRREKDFRGNWSLENGNGESALYCIQFPVGISTSDASLRLWSESWEGLKTHPESRLTSVGSMPALVNLQELLSRTGETETPPSEKDPCRHDFPTLFQRTQGFSSRWGGRRGRQVGGVFNYIKRQKGRKVEKWFGTFLLKKLWDFNEDLLVAVDGWMERTLLIPREFPLGNVGN